MCPIAVIISVKSGAHPVLHTVFHHFPQEIIHSPKQNFAEIMITDHDKHLPKFS